MISNEPLHIALVVGEVSGDILGAGLIKSLKLRYPNATFSGIAGPLMQAEGCQPIFQMDELSVMGFVEVLGRLPRILSIRRQILKHYLGTPPDIFIGIDAPDFNLDVELKLHQQGIKTIHYVSPSVWAWKQKRVLKMKRGCNKVLVFLPFEKAFYDRFDVPCDFVGHSLANQVPLQSDQQAARAALGLDPKAKILAMLPGSRNAEVGLLSPVFIEAAAKLQAQDPDLQFVVPLVNSARREQFEQVLQQASVKLNLTLVDGQSRTVMTASDCILLASGTATLEAMLVKRPMVVAYRFKPLTYHIAKLIVKAKFAALPNLLADEMIVPELIQNDCTADNIVDQVQGLFAQDNQALIEQFTELHQQIRCDADNLAADAVAEILAGQ